MFAGETILSGAPAVFYTFEVLQSGAGFYIGTRDDSGPYSRESNYLPTREDAGVLLASWEYVAFGPERNVFPEAQVHAMRWAYRANLLPEARV